MVRHLMLLAACATFWTGCATYRGELRRNPKSQTDYIVPVPQHASTVVVSAPPGWHLDPEGGPVYLGSFTHPDFFMSPILVESFDCDYIVHGMTQAGVYSHFVKKVRREESERLAVNRKFRTGFSPLWKLPQPIFRDLVSYRLLKSVSLGDGRRIELARFHTPTEGYTLRALIPEDGFIVMVEASTESSKVPEALFPPSPRRSNPTISAPQSPKSVTAESPNISRPLGLYRR